MTKVDFTLTGCANGHPVRIEGKGTATRKALRVAFTAVDRPFTFDGTVAAVAALDVVAAILTGLVIDPGEPVVARLGINLLGEGGTEVGTVVVIAEVERRRAGYLCTAQLTEARVAFEVGECVTAIGDRAIRATTLGGSLALMSAATIATSRGRDLTITTTAVLVGEEASHRRVVLGLRTAIAGASTVLTFLDGVPAPRRVKRG